MEKRRIRLEINGVVCGLITEESEEYMESLAQEVGALMGNIQAASPYITREAAALTAALSYCDDAKKNGTRADEAELELEILREEQETGASGDGGVLARQLDALREENRTLREEYAARSGEQENASLQAELEALRQENETLKTGVRAAEEEKQALSRQVQELEQTNRDYKEASLAAMERAKKVERQAEEKLRQAGLSGEQAGEKPAVQPEEPAAGDSSASEGENRGKFRNPLRHDELDREGLVSFFEKRGTK